jgi:hypothetical protein
MPQSIPRGSLASSADRTKRGRMDAYTQLLGAPAVLEILYGLGSQMTTITQPIRQHSGLFATMAADEQIHESRITNLQSPIANRELRIAMWHSLPNPWTEA